MPETQFASWTSAIGTLLAVVVALFKEDIVRHWRKPKLQAIIRLSAPDCHKTTLTFFDPKTGTVLANPDCYYFRLWVENKGKTRADRVQVFVSRLLRKHADGTFREELSFLPMNLRWSHSQMKQGGPEIFAEGISPKMGKHCDFGHIVDPKIQNINGKTVMTLDLEIAPNTGSHIIPPGEYHIELKIAASNATPKVLILEMDLIGNWYFDEGKMFTDGIGLKTIKHA